MYIELNCLYLYAIEDFDAIYCLAALWWNCLLKPKCRNVYKGERGKEISPKCMNTYLPLRVFQRALKQNSDGNYSFTVLYFLDNKLIDKLSRSLPLLLHNQRWTMRNRYPCLGMLCFAPTVLARAEGSEPLADWSVSPPLYGPYPLLVPLQWFYYFSLSPADLNKQSLGFSALTMCRVLSL